MLKKINVSKGGSKILLPSPRPRVINENLLLLKNILGAHKEGTKTSFNNPSTCFNIDKLPTTLAAHFVIGAS